MNRLATEKSPYLLQHANNPVDWYPWGDEAFEKARSEDKPVFLSIGYSTCHWCHVMEHESFENSDLAAILNRDFVSIKVDREERPDVDRIYMLFVQAATGSGGWPMTVFLTPDRKPFFGGTYFPPENRYGRPGFAAILESLAQAWKKDRARVEQSGAQVIEQLKDLSLARSGDGDARSGKDVLDAAFRSFKRSFDPRLGGFGGAPKFPRPSVLNFLLRYHDRTKLDGSVEEDALEMVLVTLREMAKGGMNDQLGGGFHRYSVDEHWFVPHFEKMLYDQAQLAISYLEAFQITGDKQYADVARSIFDYVLRDLAHPEGGFYSAEDADSAPDPAHPHEKSEGAFYIWTYAEIVKALGPESAATFARHYGIEERGNVHEDPHGEFGGRNILFLNRDSDGAATPALIAQARQALLEIRATRPRPHLDDKILTAWNALMISAFAKGARILAEPRYEAAARRALDFLRTNLWRELDLTSSRLAGEPPRNSDGLVGRVGPAQTLLRRYREGEAAIEGFLDDYAFLALALIDMYETTFEQSDLDWAVELAQRAIELFEDRDQGGFFSTQLAQADLVLRLKDDYDGAEPSGNSGMTLALLKLARLGASQESSASKFQESADRALQAMGPRLVAAPSAAPQMLVAQLFASGRPMEIVIAGPRNTDGAEAMLAAVCSRFLPDAIVMRSEQAPTAMPAIDGKPTAYVCENYACKLPVTDAQTLLNLLQ